MSSHVNVFMKTRQSYLYSSVSWRIKKKRRRGRGRSKGKKLKEDTIRAEVMMVESIADLNLSMNAASTLTSVLKVISMTQPFQNSSKHKALLVDRMKCGPFSLATDGSNDSIQNCFQLWLEQLILSLYLW